MGNLSSNMGSKMGKCNGRNDDMIEWRRAKVLELSSQGHNQSEIATIMQVGISTINRDAIYLRQQAQENLKIHVQQKLPEEYQRCLTGMNQVLKLSWEIANNNKQNGQDHNYNNNNTLTTGDERTRLQALSLINDCYKYIMDLTTNGVVVTDAIKYVQGQMDHLSKSEKALLQDIKQKEGKEEPSEEIAEGKTTNGVF
jgi:hypothetical protein